MNILPLCNFSQPTSCAPLFENCSGALAVRVQPFASGGRRLARLNAWNLCPTLCLSTHSVSTDAEMRRCETRTLCLTLKTCCCETHETFSVTLKRVAVSDQAGLPRDPRRDRRGCAHGAAVGPARWLTSRRTCVNRIRIIVLYRKKGARKSDEHFL